MTTRPLRTSIAALLAASVLLAGCNDDDKDSKDAKEPGSDASSSSGTTGSPTDEGSSDTGSTGAAPAGELDKDTFYPEVLRAQQDAGSYRTTTTTSTAGITIVADGEVTYADGKPKAHSKSTPDSPQQVESVVADGIVY